MQRLAQVAGSLYWERGWWPGFSFIPSSGKHRKSHRKVYTKRIGLVSKDACGKNVLYRISEMVTSGAKVDLPSQILWGAFGCNPEVFFNNNTY